MSFRDVVAAIKHSQRRVVRRPPGAERETRAHERVAAWWRERSARAPARDDRPTPIYPRRVVKTTGKGDASFVVAP